MGAGAGAVDARTIQTVLEACVADQGIQAFYPPGSPQLAQIAQRVASSGALDNIATAWKMPREIASDLVKLALFDTILYVDDSGSMAFEESVFICFSASHSTHPNGFPGAANVSMI